MRIRPERVGHLMRREIADILSSDLRDPRLSAMVSVTDVEVTPDLSFARVFVSVLADENGSARALEGLARAAGYIRRQLAPRLGLREVPELRFLIDPSIQQGARVDDLLRRIEKGEKLEDEES
ncbi:MAG: 30S ribosome-binding factor RbfA [Candidatus Eisenbacteria bacterium]